MIGKRTRCFPEIHFPTVKEETRVLSPERLTGALSKIRTTEITCWDIYRALTFQKMSEDQVLNHRPDLTREDIAAVRDYAATLMQDRAYYQEVSRTVLSKVKSVDEQYGATMALCSRCHAETNEVQDSICLLAMASPS